MHTYIHSADKINMNVRNENIYVTCTNNAYVENSNMDIYTVSCIPYITLVIQ